MVCAYVFHMFFGFLLIKVCLMVRLVYYHVDEVCVEDFEFVVQKSSFPHRQEPKCAHMSLQSLAD